MTILKHGWQRLVPVAGALGVAIGTLSYPLAARGEPYSVEARAAFLSGCLQENPPNYNDAAAVTERLQLCVCLLDRFQDKYPSDQFARLFTDLESQRPDAEREVDRFITRHLDGCL